MNVSPLLAALLLGLSAPLARPLPPAVPVPEIVELRDGTLLHGDITAFDEATGVTMKLLDTGGVVSLRWEHLAPDEVRRVKASRGFTGEEVERWMVDVVHLVMRNGTTETGVLEQGGDPSSYTLRRRGARASFPRDQVGAVEPGQVEGLEVYTPDELYREIQSELGAPTDAASQLQFAIACEGAKLYEAARDHYQTVQQLDPDLKSELIATRLAQISIKLEDAAETAELDEVRSRLYRKQFEQALKQARAFRETYPASRQMGDLVQLEGEIARRKKEFYARRVVSDYFDQLGQRLFRLAHDKSVTLDVARDVAENLLHTELIETLASDYNMTPAGVLALWEARRGGSVRTSSYGDGTFILGRDAALKFGHFDQQADQSSTQEDAPAEGFDDLVAKVKKQREALAQQRRGASRGSSLADVGPTPDEWWTNTDADSRLSWITAYYAEYGGQLRVIEAKSRPCRRCNGDGVVQGTNEKGEIVELVCPVCKGLKLERIVRAR